MRSKRFFPFRCGHPLFVNINIGSSDPETLETNEYVLLFIGTMCNLSIDIIDSLSCPEVDDYVSEEEL